MDRKYTFFYNDPCIHEMLYLFLYVSSSSALTTIFLHASLSCVAYSTGFEFDVLVQSFTLLPKVIRR